MILVLGEFCNLRLIDAKPGVHPKEPKPEGNKDPAHDQ